MSILFKINKYECNRYISLKMTVDRVDDTPIVEHNTLTQKIKQKSKKIVMDAEKGKESLNLNILPFINHVVYLLLSISLYLFNHSLFDGRRSQTCN